MAHLLCISLFYYLQSAKSTSHLFLNDSSRNSRYDNGVSEIQKLPAFHQHKVFRKKEPLRCRRRSGRGMPDTGKNGFAAGSTPAMMIHVAKLV
ncbi:hypothetical protein C3R19_04150 [Blautia producta]|nr:hypothetical protein C3R19_04150 [Blautia producta]